MRQRPAPAPTSLTIKDVFPVILGCQVVPSHTWQDKKTKAGSIRKQESKKWRVAHQFTTALIGGACEPCHMKVLYASRSKPLSTAVSSHSTSMDLMCW
eukprot:2067832-Amphidinium_carterae.1